MMTYFQQPLTGGSTRRSKAKH